MGWLQQMVVLGSEGMQGWRAVKTWQDQWSVGSVGMKNYPNWDTIQQTLEYRRWMSELKSWDYGGFGNEKVWALWWKCDFRSVEDGIIEGEGVGELRSQAVVRIILWVLKWPKVITGIALGRVTVSHMFKEWQKLGIYQELVDSWNEG